MYVKPCKIVHYIELSFVYQERSYMYSLHLFTKHNFIFLSETHDFVHHLSYVKRQHLQGNCSVSCFCLVISRLSN